MTRKNKSITLSLSLHQKQSLEELAQVLGYFWGESPNISALVGAIADGDIQLSSTEGLSQKSRTIAIKEDILEIQKALLRIEQNL